MASCASKNRIGVNLTEHAFYRTSQRASSARDMGRIGTRRRDENRHFSPNVSGNTVSHNLD